MKYEVMKHRAKTYFKFINEAYINREGELEGLDFSPEEKAELEIYDELNVISEFLEDSGAREVKIDTSLQNDEKYLFFFVFNSQKFEMLLNLETDEVVLFNLSGRGEEPIEQYRSDANEFFDLLRNTGLDFLLY
ncbi:hypothetical protein UFOVP699_131 [uncultured Caudovirales phage]|uniref:Uncharacterized protein n=1 Tax=uncultured Caudovirales phage TaxID=2100421 RepID=A0A6J5NQH7_9CAUD|nr:hypothetical protein UFOVP699_131 [uncultured Caudovirales phage]